MYVALLHFQASPSFNAGIEVTREKKMVIADESISLKFTNMWGNAIVFLMFFVPIYSFFPITFALYCKLTWRVHGVLMLFVCIGIAILLYLPPLKTFGVAIPFTIWIPAFYYVLPRDSKIT